MLGTMVRVANILAITIGIMIAFHAADAARIIPAMKNSKQVAFSDYNSTTSVGHHSRPQARTLYTDGEGTYITSDSEHHYASGVKCWTDYFVVQQGLAYGDWKKASGNLFCTDTSSCQFQHMEGYQTCQTWSVSLSAGIEASILSFGVEGGYETEDCNTGTDTTSCTWSDAECHCIWTQQELMRQSGYSRRRCSSNNGDYTASMEDWIHDRPTKNVNYGCGSKCTDT